jgi:hypothetical protein
MCDFLHIAIHHIFKAGSQIIMTWIVQEIFLQNRMELLQLTNCCKASSKAYLFPNMQALFSCLLQKGEKKTNNPPCFNHTCITIINLQKVNNTHVIRYWLWFEVRWQTTMQKPRAEFLQRPNYIILAKLDILKRERIVKKKITSMLLDVGLDSNKYFELILLSKAVTYQASTCKFH